MTAEEIMAFLHEKGAPGVKKIFMNHGAPETVLGVKVGDLKVIQKKIKKDHELAKTLYDTNISDAMYLAGLIGDGARMTPEELNDWASKASWYMISEYTVPWIACDNKDAWNIAGIWIESPEESIAAAGWATLSNLVSLYDDSRLDINILEKLIDRVKKNIHAAPNRVRYTMNGFLIAVGSYVAQLTDKAKKAAAEIGKVEVNLGDTACRVPDPIEYIDKMEKAGKIGKKKKEVRC